MDEWEEWFIAEGTGHRATPKNVYVVILWECQHADNFKVIKAFYNKADAEAYAKLPFDPQWPNAVGEVHECLLPEK